MTPIPSIATSTVPRGAKDVKVVTISVRMRCNPARLRRLTGRIVSPVPGCVTSSPSCAAIPEALLESEHAELQNISGAEHIRTLLLEHAIAVAAPKNTIEKFKAVTCQPRYPHDDHFHFRFFCTPDDIRAGCRDSQPIYPWQRAALHAAGVKPLPLAPKRATASAKIVTHEEARKAAGTLDPEVERWLDLREQWIQKPHPGRTYCR